MNLLETAIMIATKAHAGQLDKGGQPYILHPLSVMMRVDRIEEKIVALLHDVIEDSDVTMDQLKGYGFSAEIVTAVDALTHQPEESYENYIERIAKNRLATTVKLADLKENMNLSRIPNPTKRDQQRLLRYQNAYQRLENFR